MTDWVKSIKREAIKYREDGEMHKPNFTAKIILLLIKEIEKSKENLCVANELNAQLNKMLKKGEYRCY